MKVKRQARTAALLVLVDPVVLELGLRLVLGGAEHGVLYQFRPGDGRCVGLRPGTSAQFTGFLLRRPTIVMEVNAQGYRGPERPQTKPPHTFRIAAVGDSYAYGVSVTTDEAIPAYLERALRPRPIEVLNFGIPGAQLEDEIPQASIFASRWHPDVILEFLFWNDLDQSLCSWSSGGTALLARLAKHIYVFRIPVILKLVLGGRSIGTVSRRTTELRAKLADLQNVGRPARLAVVVLGDPILRNAAVPTEPSAGLQEAMRALGIPWLDARIG
jgi:hypothetical protein